MPKCVQLYTEKRRSRWTKTADLRFWNDSTHVRTWSELCVLPCRQNHRTHVVVVVYEARTRLLCSFLSSFQDHRHCIHRHQSIPRHHHGHTLHLERLTLEIQCHWTAAIHQNVKTATNIPPPYDCVYTQVVKYVKQEQQYNPVKGGSRWHGGVGPGFALTVTQSTSYLLTYLLTCCRKRSSKFLSLHCFCHQAIWCSTAGRWRGTSRDALVLQLQLVSGWKSRITDQCRMIGLTAWADPLPLTFTDLTDEQSL